MALWLLGDRLVVDTDDWEGPGGWNDDPRSGYSALQRRFFAWQERYGLSHAHAWTAASRCLRQRAIDFGAAPERVFLLPNGVSEREFPPAASGPAGAWWGGARQAGGPGAAQVLLYTRFAGVRVVDVAAIWGRVLSVLPEARLVVLGRGLAGEENELAQLRAQCRCRRLAGARRDAGALCAACASLWCPGQTRRPTGRATAPKCLS